MGSSSGVVSRIGMRGRIVFLVCLSMAAVDETRAAGSDPRVAFVYALSGEASVTVNGRTKPLGESTWLPSGARVRGLRAAHVQLAFLGGARYVLGEGARATVGPSALSRIAGPVRSLDPVPPLPLIPPLADEAAGRQMGAIRIRAKGLRVVWPVDASSTLADDTVLGFAPIALRSRYRVEVTDQHGKVVLAQDTAAAEVRLPAGTLAPGRRYYWTVRTADGGTLASAGASFATLDRETEARLQAFRAGLVDPADDHLPALAAEVYRRLGLQRDARKELDGPEPLRGP
jgi:hypothetical protein